MIADIEAIRSDLAAIRDRLEEIEAKGAARVIVEAAAGALTTVLVALNHDDMSPEFADLTAHPQLSDEALADLHGDNPPRRRRAYRESGDQ